MTRVRILSAIYSLRDRHPLEGDVHTRVARFIGTEPTEDAVTAHLVPMRIQGSKRSALNKLRLVIDGAEHVVALGDVRHAVELRILTAVVDTGDADLTPFASDLKALGVGADSIDEWVVAVRDDLEARSPRDEPVVPLEIEPTVKLTFRSRALPPLTYVPFVPRVIERSWWKR